MDKYSTNFQLQKDSGNFEFLRAFDDGNGEGLKIRINDGNGEITFPIGDEDVAKLLRFLGYYLQEKAIAS